MVCGEVSAKICRPDAEAQRLEQRVFADPRRSRDYQRVVDFSSWPLDAVRAERLDVPGVVGIQSCQQIAPAPAPPARPVHSAGG